MSVPSSRDLLVALSADHSYAWLSEEGGDLRIVARRRGVSVETGRFPAGAGEALVEAGFAAWEPPARAGRARLALTAEGRARAALARGPEGLEPARALQGAVVRRGAVLVEEAESPLAWLARRRGRDGAPLLAPELLQAGERLRADLDLARALPRVTALWDGAPAQRRGAPHSGPITETALAARQRVDRAMAAAGPEFSGLLLDVCGFLKGLETIEAERGWPRRSARIVLDLALTRLARHYGLAPAQGRAHAPMRHWGAEDYRPALS